MVVEVDPLNRVQVCVCQESAELLFVRWYFAGNRRDLEGIVIVD